MGSLGTEEYPDIPLENAVQYLHKCFRVVSEGIDIDGLAQALELKPRTGGFARVLSSMRRYGLLEGQGTLKSTDLASRLLHGFTQSERDRARSEAWLNVRLIREINNRYKSVIPDKEGEFMAFLSKITGAAPPEVQAKAASIRSLVEASVKDLRMGNGETKSSSEYLSGAGIDQPKPTGTSAEFLDAKVGDVYVRIPRSQEGLELARKIVELLAIQIDKPSDGRPAPGKVGVEETA